MSELNGINLVPNEIIEEKIIQERILRGFFLLISLVVVLILIGSAFTVSGRRIDQEVLDLQPQDEEVNRLESSLAAECEDIKKLLRQRELLLTLTQGDCFTPLVNSLAQAVTPQTKMIEVAMKIGGDNTLPKGPPLHYTLSLSGQCRSYQDLSNFLLNLQNTPSFREVTLIKSDMDDLNNSAIRFEISLCSQPAYRQVGN